VRELGLDPRHNVSFPRGLASLAGLGSRRFAVIDVGTNSVKFHLAEARPRGGWKTLADRAVTREEFRATAREVLGVQAVHDYYGMVEQVGSVYVECEQGFFHAPGFAEVLVRDWRDWSVAPHGTEGILQTLSVLPRSYPGHSLLTEDLGTVHGRDDCACGRVGTRFTVRGRLPRAELRGCSDTLAVA
jgi:hypothetical protein